MTNAATAPTCPPPDPHPKTPRFRLPALACDAHFHVFGPHDVFPFAADRTFTPHDAPKAALLALHRFLGFERGVFVQSSCHGTDHAALADLLASTGGRYRGVALLTPATPAREVTVMGLIAPHRWHVALHMTGKDLIAYFDFITSIAAPVVIDHIGRVEAAEGPEGAAFQALRRLLDRGNVWVKLSGTDRVSSEPPPFRDAVALARNLAEHAPERVVWGTDWPHPNHHSVPNDGDLVDLIPAIAVHEKTQHRMLVDNPAELFGFG